LRARTLLETLLRYSDPEKVTWIHSMDGGISDNLALRLLLADALLMEAQAEQLRPELLPVRRLLVISVKRGGAPQPQLAKTIDRRRARTDRLCRHGRPDQGLQP